MNDKKRGPAGMGKPCQCIILLNICSLGCSTFIFNETKGISLPQLDRKLVLLKALPPLYNSEYQQ